MGWFWGSADGVRVTSLRSGTHGPYRFGSFVPGTAGQLCAQAVADARLSVDQVMQLVLVRHARIPSDPRTIARRRIKGGLSLTQCGIRRRINGEFTADGSCGKCYCHRENIPRIEHMCKRCPAQTWVESMRCCSFPPRHATVGLRTRDDLRYRRRVCRLTT